MGLQPKQFRQQTLWPTAAEPTHVAGSGQPRPMGIRPSDRRDLGGGQVEFQTHRDLPGGGSQSSWQSQYSLGRFGDRLNPQSRTNPAREAELDSGQRAMFMTPREIHERYQPLDGDRHGSDASGSHEFTTSGGWAATTGSPERIARDNEVETDDELWDRKLDESQYSKDEYMGMRGGLMGTGTNTFMQNLQERDSYPWQRLGEATDDYVDREDSYIAPKVDDWREAKNQSLYDSIRDSGVRSPVRLGEEEGMMSKPEIVGGHHRLAAATDIDEDMLMPVLHHRNIWEAQNDEKVTKAYPYS